MPPSWHNSLRAPRRSLYSTQPAPASQHRKIVPGDLGATLESHRTANRESLIHKHGVEDSEASHTQGKKAVIAKRGKAAVTLRSHLRHREKQGNSRQNDTKLAGRQTIITKYRSYDLQKGKPLGRVSKPRYVESASNNARLFAPWREIKISQFDGMSKAEREYSHALQKNAQELGALGVYIKPLSVASSEARKPYLVHSLKPAQDASEVSVSPALNIMVEG